MITLWTILFALIAGGILGYSGTLKDFFEKHLDNIITLGLVILLFSMGIKIGINEEILSSLTNLSVKAAVISICAITGSVLIMRILTAKFFQ